LKTMPTTLTKSRRTGSMPLAHHLDQFSTDESGGV